MSIPPNSPPSSDIAGVHRDGVAVNTPENPRPDPGQALDDADKQSKGQPESDPANKADTGA